MKERQIVSKEYSYPISELNPRFKIGDMVTSNFYPGGFFIGLVVYSTDDYIQVLCKDQFAKGENMIKIKMAAKNLLLVNYPLG